MKTLQLRHSWGTVELYLKVEKYLKPVNTAITLWINVDGEYEQYNVLTKNFEQEWPEGYAYIDTNNNPGVLELLLDAGLVELTGIEELSGFCTYPLVTLDLEKIKEYQIPSLED